MQATPTPLEVVIIGGSIAGLFHALVLKRLGYNVRVLEKSPASVLQSEAAGLRAGPDVQRLINEYVQPAQPYATTSTVVNVIDVQGALINVVPSNDSMHLTTWSLLHGMLKSSLLKEGSAASVATYETDKLVEDVKYDGGKVTVAYSDTKTGISNVLNADLVISADGGHSKIRETVLPGLSPKYVGYVTWRGAVPESAISEASRKSLQNKVLLFRTERGYTISYHVPSESGSLEPGDRQFIWVWYEQVEEDSDDFRDIFTDVTGKRHFTTIPRGKIHPRVWNERQERSEALSIPFAELLEKTSDPFVSAIRECAAPQSVFHDGKLLLVGDAFTLFRPHVASSTNQAALQALGLAEVLHGRGNLAEWEREALQYAARTSALSVAFAEYCFTGKVPGSLSTAIKSDDQLK